MVVENVNIYDLIPSQIQELIEKLSNALEIVKNRKQTISKVVLFEKEKKCCSHCDSTNFIKYGHKNNVQNYPCKECHHKFNDLTGTVFAGTRLNYEQIEIFIQCFHDKVSLRKTAKRMKVDKNTVHLLRLKVIDSLKNIRKNTKLIGDTEADEIYRSINLKSTKRENMPRASKPRKSKGTTARGISKHKVCIMGAIDEFDNKFLEIAGTGPVTSDMVKEILTPKMGKIKKLTTDCKSSYESEATKHNWNLKQVKSCCYTDEDGNSLSNINSLHSGLTNFLSCFRGVSTKHLQGYLDWYIFDKYMNYSFDENNRFNVILKTSSQNSTNIKNSNMYANYSNIDFEEVYSDYYFMSPTPKLGHSENN